MSFNIGGIAGSLRIDPDAAGQDNQRKRERKAQKKGSGDSVSISDEARKLLSEGYETGPEGAEQ